MPALKEQDILSLPDLPPEQDIMSLPDAPPNTDIMSLPDLPANMEPPAPAPYNPGMYGIYLPNMQPDKYGDKQTTPAPVDQKPEPIDPNREIPTWADNPVSEFVRKVSADPNANTIASSVAQGVEQGANDVGSLINRGLSTVGLNVGDSDTLNRMQTADQSQFTEAHPGMLPQTIAGATRSLTQAVPASMLGGAPAAIVAAMGTTANQATTEGKDIGLSGIDLASHVLQQAAWEGVPAALFQAAGVGGMEKVLGNAFKGGAKEVGKGLLSTLKTAGIDLASELTEEEITSLGQSVSSKLSGVNPDALTPEQLKATILDTAAQTAFTMGLVSGPSIAKSAAQTVKTAIPVTDTTKPGITIEPAPGVDVNGDTFTMGTPGGQTNEQPVQGEIIPTENIAPPEGVQQSLPATGETVESQSQPPPKTPTSEQPMLPVAGSIEEAIAALPEAPAQITGETVTPNLLASVKNSQDLENSQPSAATTYSDTREISQGENLSPQEIVPNAKPAEQPLGPTENTDVVNQQNVGTEPASTDPGTAPIDTGTPEAVPADVQAAQTEVNPRVAAYNEARGEDRQYTKAQTPEDLTQNRWDALEREYKRAKLLEDALPESKPEDRVTLTVEQRQADGSRKIIDVEFVDRSNQKEASDALWEKYKGKGYSVAMTYSGTPTNPRLGEPTYKQWKAGARPDIAELTRKQQEAVDRRRAQRLKGQLTGTRTRDEALAVFRDYVKKAGGVRIPRTSAGAPAYEDFGFTSRPQPGLFSDKARLAWDQVAQEFPELFMDAQGKPDFSPMKFGELLRGKNESKSSDPYSGYTEDEVIAAELNKMETRGRDTTEVNSTELDPGDLVFTEGEWHSVKNRKGGGKLLKDGETRELDDFETTNVNTVIKKGDSAYEEALRRYKVQEAQNKKARRQKAAEPTQEPEPAPAAENPAEDLSALSREAQEMAKLYKGRQKAADVIERQLETLRKEGKKNPNAERLLNELRGDPEDIFGSNFADSEPQAKKQSTGETQSRRRGGHQDAENAAEQSRRDYPRSGEKGSRSRPRIELPELVDLGRRLLNSVPKVREKLMGNRGIRGLFSPGTGGIELRGDIFIGPEIGSQARLGETKEEMRRRISEEYGIDIEDVVIRNTKKGYVAYERDPDYAARTLAHEIGHGIDWLQDKDIDRGNILGHIAALHNYRENLIGKDFAHKNETITKEEIDAWKKEASEPEPGGWQDVTRIVEEFVPGTGITVEDIKAIWTSIESQRGTPLYEYISRLNSAEKVRIAKAAMRGIVDPSVAHLSGGSTVRRTITERIFKQGRPRTKAEIERLFKARLTDEIQRRELHQNKIIREELKDLSRWWKPFDPKADKGYTAYRHSSVELYADALSVLLNNPEAIEARAPNFMKAFDAFVDARPEVRDTMNRIYDEINMNRTPEARLDRLRQMMDRDEQIRADLAGKRKTERMTPTEMAKSVAYFLWNKNVYAPREAQVALQDITYSGARAQQYYRDYEDRIFSGLRDAGVDIGDFGIYLMQRRAAGERSDMANPGGIRGEDSVKLMDTLRDAVTPDQWQAIEKAGDELVKIRNEHVIPLLEESRLFTPELMEKIKDNDEYVKFQVLDYLEANHGGGGEGSGVPHIYRQIGTLKDVSNPLYPTMMQDISLIHAALTNIGKQTCVDNMGVATARRDRNGSFVAPKEKDMGLLVLSHDGQLAGYYVRKEVADMFNKRPAQANIIFKALQVLTVPFKQVLTTNNPFFGIWNLQRDFRTSLRQLPGNFLTAPPKLVWSYATTARDAYLDAFKKQSTKRVADMYKNGLLISNRHWDAMERDSVETELERYSLLFDAEPTDKMALWRRAGKAIFSDANSFMERWGKIAGTKYMQDRGVKIDSDQMKQTIRGQAGSPDFLARGTGTQWLNSLFIFSNAGIQGWRSTANAFKADPVNVGMKTLLYSVLPKLVMIGLAKGWLDDDEDGGWFKQAYSKIGEYDKTLRFCIPLWHDGAATGYIPMPDDHVGELIGSILWNALGSDNPNWAGEAGSRITGANPFDITKPNPIVKGLLLDIPFYVSGMNPPDFFRGGPAINETIRKAGGVRSAMEFGKYEWNQTAGTVLGRFGSPFDVREREGWERALQLPGLQQLRRFYRVSDQGSVDAEMYTEKADEKVKAQQTVPVKDWLSEYVRDNVNEDKDRRAWQAAWRKARAAEAIPQGYSVERFKAQWRSLTDRKLGEK